MTKAEKIKALHRVHLLCVSRSKRYKLNPDQPFYSGLGTVVFDCNFDPKTTSEVWGLIVSFILPFSSGKTIIPFESDIQSTKTKIKKLITNLKNTPYESLY